MTIIAENIEPQNGLDDDKKNSLLFDEELILYHDRYYKLHSSFLRPTKIKIDVNFFKEEIKRYHSKFRYFTNKYYKQRYCISLVNIDGTIDKEHDITAQPLDLLPASKHIADWEITKKTEVYKNLKSLTPLRELDEYLTRSQILLWHKNASFVPHIDTWPDQSCKNLRFWGVTNPENYIFKSLGESVNMEKIEPGRIYLVDTTQWHYAKATGDWQYTFFLSTKLNDSVINLLEKLLL